MSLIAIFAFASAYLMAMLFNPELDPSRIYFGTDTRVSALLIGAIVAMLFRETDKPLNATTYFFLNFVSFISIIGLVSFCFFVQSSDEFLFRGGFFSVSILTSSIIASCLRLSKIKTFSLVLWFLNNAFLRFIGIRAYGIYLWHWSIFALTQPFVDVPFDGLTLLFFRLSLTFIFSEITFRFVEKPIRNGRLEHFFVQQKSAALWLFAGSMSLVGCSGLMIVTEQKLETTPQYVINETINEKASSLNEGALDVTLIERSKNDAVCDVEANTQIISNDNKLFLVTDQTATTEKTLKLNTIKMRPEEIKIQATMLTKNRLQFERAKDKGYVNRVTTIEKAGEKSPVFLLGDSVMVGATNELVKRIPNASLDSQVGRQLSKGIQILNERKANNTLSDTVIIHLGNNSPITPHQIDDLVSLLTEKRKIVFVNLKLPRNYESANNQLLDDAAKKHPNIRIVDWHSRSMNAVNVFGKDGIHLLGNGAKLYADLIVNALK